MTSISNITVPTAHSGRRERLLTSYGKSKNEKRMNNIYYQLTNDTFQGKIGLRARSAKSEPEAYMREQFRTMRLIA